MLRSGLFFDAPASRRSPGRLLPRAARSLIVLPLLLSGAEAAGGAEAGAGQAAFEAPGVTAETVRFGQSAALSGPAAALGTGMRLGLRAAFHEVNEGGGVHGRRLELTSLDDGYEPERTIENARKLLNEEQVFALIGAVGTPTSRAAEPLAEEAGAPYIGPFTGAEFLRDRTQSPTVVNVRASYFQETAEMVRHLVDDFGISRIGILRQDDSYGNAGLEGLRRALARRGLELTGQAAYQRNTTAVKSALLDLRDAQPEAVVMIGAYQPVAEFVRWARKIQFDPVMMTISFVGSEALVGELGSAGEGVYITQVVPFPEDGGSPLIRRYRRALGQVARPAPRPSFVSLEGYVTGRLAAEVLERAGPEPTQERFLEAMTTLGRLNLDGFRLAFGPEDNQGSDAVFLTRIEADGRLRPLAGN